MEQQIACTSKVLLRNSSKRRFSNKWRSLEISKANKNVIGSTGYFYNLHSASSKLTETAWNS
jgi:hypothetical protein